jgi:endonuclease III
MSFWPKHATPVVIALLVATCLNARADDRSALEACEALIDRAARTPRGIGTAAAALDAPLERCKIVIREWTLRDSRMLVDERGRPLR